QTAHLLRECDMVGVVVITEDLEERTNAPGRHAGIVDRIGVTVADARDILEQLFALLNRHVLHSSDQSLHRTASFLHPTGYARLLPVLVLVSREGRPGRRTNHQGPSTEDGQGRRRTCPGLILLGSFS